MDLANLSNMNKIMAAAVWGMEFYNEYLKGKHFVLYTDHKSLEKLGHLQTKILNYQQLVMLKYDFQIQYKKGVTMPADYLSHTHIDNVAAIQNAKATAAAIDPFTPTLVEEQASRHY